MMLKSLACGVCRTALLSGHALAATDDAKSAALARLTGAFDGWRHGGLTNESEEYGAAYPRAPVDRGAHRFRTLIQGLLKRLGPHARRVPALVVNGNPTPLYTDEQGWFARPCVFGAGSTSIELISANGTKPQAQLSAIVTWDDPAGQVDLHVIAPDGLRAFFANPTLEDRSGFDVDSVDGAGAGICSSAAPERGTWFFFLNDGATSIRPVITSIPLRMIAT